MASQRVTLSVVDRVLAVNLLEAYAEAMERSLPVRVTVGFEDDYVSYDPLPLIQDMIQSEKTGGFRWAVVLKQDQSLGDLTVQIYLATQGSVWLWLTCEWLNSKICSASTPFEFLYAAAPIELSVQQSVCPYFGFDDQQSVTSFQKAVNMAVWIVREARLDLQGSHRLLEEKLLQVPNGVMFSGLLRLRVGGE